MLEGLVAWVLNTYLGEYVEDLNTDQLSVGILRGQVNLENLPLKKDALKSLDLPLTVKSGFIGKISLQVPLRRLKSEPWVITLEKLYLVAGPLFNYQYDEKEEKKKECARKKAQLSEVERKWQILRYVKAVLCVRDQASRQTGLQQGGGNSWWSYGTSLVTNIVENLQLNVRDIHLRYEDDVTIPDHPFACGAIIKSLSAQSTDASWVPQFVSRYLTDMMRKLLKLGDFSIYWDSDAEMIGGLSRPDLEDALQRQMYISSSTGQFKDHEYILQPVSASAQMKRNTSALPLRKLNKPRITLDVDMGSISLSLSHAQYRCIVAWGKELTLFNKRRKFTKWRPSCSVKENARSWWRYGINTTLQGIQDANKRRSQQFMLQRTRDNVLYVEAYRALLTQTDKYMDKSLKAHLEKMEEDWSIEEISILREVVTTRLTEEDKLVQDTKGEVPEASSAASVSPASQQAGGVLQGWFPGWSGWSWYGGGTTQPGSDDLALAEEMLQADVREKMEAEDVELEQGILDVLQDSSENDTLLKRDLIFAQTNFCLQGCVVKLLHNNDISFGGLGGSLSEPCSTPQCLLELECTAVKAGLESRPRSNGLKFEVSVGALYLRDKMTQKSIMPVLIAPQAREGMQAGRSMMSGGMGLNFPFRAGSYMSPGGILTSLNQSQLSDSSTGTKGPGGSANQEEAPLFELVYDKKPLHSVADYRVKIKTKPLDIVYNKDAINMVKEFFMVKKEDALKTELEIGAAAKSRYEELKRQTQQELRQTLDQLIEGDEKIKAKRWDFDLDVSAPQFIIPDSFKADNPNVVVVDLGRLQFHNVNGGMEKKSSHLDSQLSVDDDDDFVTPSSTPPNAEDSVEKEADKTGSSQKMSDIFSEDITEGALHDKIYDKYTLGLSEAQLMVGKAKDNWRHAHYKGTSHLHVVDKLSMVIQLDRRLLYTSDPQWPKVTLSGTLPSLTLHVNETKVEAVRNMLALIQEPVTSSPQPENLRRSDNEESMYQSMYQAYNKSLVNLSEDVDEKAKQAIAESRLLLAQFSINQVSLEVQSRGCSIAELQVGGVRANFTHRPFDTSFSFSVHSLLVVDAMQTFGQDFELLAASHRNICLDSTGSIRDSDPNSPTSPCSPLSPQSPAEPVRPPARSHLQNMQTALTTAVQGLVNAGSTPESDTLIQGVSPMASLNLPPKSLFLPSPVLSHDSDALIKLEVDLVNPAGAPDDPSADPVNIASIQFNNLDLIANQETLVELMAFFQRVMPAKDKSGPAKKNKWRDLDELQAKDRIVGSGSTRWSLTADFNRLNLLLMRVEMHEQQSVGRKVATATLSEAKIRATIEDQIDVEVSLGGIQLLDLTPEGNRHQKVFSVGIDPSSTKALSASGSSQVFAQLRKVDLSRDPDDLLPYTEEQDKAFIFTFKRSDPTEAFDQSPCKSPGAVSGAQMEIGLRLASMCYTHTPAFIKDISNCLTDLKGYVERVGRSIKVAATEVAKEYLHKKSDLHNSMVFGSTFSLDSSPAGRPVSIADPFSEDIPYSSNRLKIDAHLNTPVIMLPRKPNSPEVLVAHLGEMHITNTDHREPVDQFNFPSSSDSTDSILLRMSDASLYSMDLEKQKSLKHYAKKHGGCQRLAASAFKTPQPGGAISTNYGFPILHNTSLEISLEKKELMGNVFTSLDSDDTSNHPHGKFAEPPPIPANSEIMMVFHGRVISPLKVGLCKQVFEQILQTLDNIAPDDDKTNTDMSQPHPSKSDIAVGMFTDSSAGVLPSISETQTANKDRQGMFSREKSPTDASSDDNKVLVVDGTFEMPNFEVTVTGDLDKSHSDRKMSQAEEYLSQSCPSSMIDIPAPSMPPSLPSSLHQLNVFDSNHQRSKQGSIHTHQLLKDYPSTPPCSPIRRGSVDNNEELESMLVHMKILLVDKKCPHFATTYNKTNRYIYVDFNCLDTTINLQTWVVLLDFLGLGAKVHDPDQFTKEAQMAQSPTSELGSPSEASVASSSGTSINIPPQGETTNNEVELHIQSLALILNKPEYELAKASVSHVNLHVSARDSNFAMKGQLGSMALLDQSPHGYMYRERFVTTGTQALDIDIFKHGLPDPDLLRPNDVKVHFKMASVWYVHTHRFIQETLAFIQHFNQLQDVLGRMRAASAGKKITEKASRNPRIALDIEAGAPVIFIPHSSRTHDILVMDLGTLRVLNKFCHAGTEGTMSYKNKRKATQSVDESVKRKPSSPAGGGATDEGLNLLASGNSDVMTQSLYGSLLGDWRSEEVESTPPVLRSASQGSVLGGFHSALGSGMSSQIGGVTPLSKSSTHPSSVGRRPLTLAMESCPSDTAEHVCLLDVMHIELNDIDLFSAQWRSKQEYDSVEQNKDFIFTSYVVQRESGQLMKEQCRLDVQVERNLEGDLSHSVPDFSIHAKLSSVHFSLDLEQYKLVRGLLVHNFGEPLEEFQRPLMANLKDPKIETVLSGEVWKTISISMELDGVIVELLLSHGINTEELSLAKFNFITSRLSFESYSDGCKDIDLVSHEIRVSDTRYRDAPVNVRPNVFSEILKPSSTLADDSVKTLQMELHFRITKDFDRFTVLLNNMRVMGIFDWLLAVKDFLLTGPDDPFSDRRDNLKKTEPMDVDEDGNIRPVSPLAASGGILTKRAPIPEKKEQPFELRLNVTDTELVVVEDTRERDTNAVILKSTAVLSYRPNFAERPLSCSLQSLEVFSCSLAAENETALSIIDPMIVTAELNGSALTHHRTHGAAGLADASELDDKPPVLEISFATLNVRLSYNDIQLFTAIMKSTPKQLLEASKQQSVPKSHISEELVRRLEDLGFNRPDCEKALQVCKGRLDESATWLTQNATPRSPRLMKNAAMPVKKKGLQMSGFELKAGCISLCLIDDCQDADIPLAELNMVNVYMLHKLPSLSQLTSTGIASFKLSGDYYNRSLSGWEPFFETWGCRLEWEKGASPQTGKEDCTKCSLIASDVLNLNMTSEFMELVKMTKTKWTEDYYRANKSSDSETQMYNSRKRVPFIPFAIKNDTGCQLQFTTGTSTLASSPDDTGSKYEPKALWKTVMPGDELPFLIEERDKIRHKNTHELKVHQVRVKVEGLEEVAPISVDRVGVYFRMAQRDSNRPKRTPIAARLVFDISMSGTARKLITVRSGLVINNRLTDDVEINMFPKSEDNKFNTSMKPVRLTVPSMSRQSVPLPLVHHGMWIRPVGWSLSWCKTCLNWSDISKPGGYENSQQACDTTGASADSYRFCMSVYRQHFPPDPPALQTKASPAQSPREYSPTGIHPTQQESPAPTIGHPGHVVTLVPPLVVENLLPVDMSYSIKMGRYKDIPATLKPGKSASVYSANISETMELILELENFQAMRGLVIPPGTGDQYVNHPLLDTQQRLVELRIVIRKSVGGSLKVSVTAPYWLVNKTGLPIIFKQDTCDWPSAGQFEDHEIARSVAPLLFSYSDKDKPHFCSMRLGRSVHGKANHRWCTRFGLDRGPAVRQLHACPTDGHPDRVYNIGIDVRQGRGRYSHTNIVTFTPRFQLDNKSKHKLAFTQRHFVRERPNTGEYLSAMPNSMLAYHWPRVDFDQLLCVRIMDDHGTRWSGGFRIDLIDSFHINMRSENNKCVFLRVDIVLQGASFFVVFSNADDMPPPYRIDNFSEVPLTYYQTKIADESLRAQIPPRTCMPYAWDEPILPPYMTLKVAGCSSATYNLNQSADGDQLTYENFIYIAFSATFQRTSPGDSYSQFVESQQLVLDVNASNKVILRRKEAGKRSQLWRMTSDGKLQHEGSSAPRDPRMKPPSGSQQSSSTSLVLDIQDLAPQPTKEMLLIVRKPDVRRTATQQWHFTQDGRLCSEAGPNLCVQAKEGMIGLHDGGEAVLGPCLPASRALKEAPPEMHVHRQKLRPGSGFLSVKVLTDGPTRVLQITDIIQQQYTASEKDDWVSVKSKKALPILKSSDKSVVTPEKQYPELEMMVQLEGGMGISVVNSAKQELVYAKLTELQLDYCYSQPGVRVYLKVKNIQVDNQLLGNHCPVILWVSPPSASDPHTQTRPALVVDLFKLHNRQWNAEIFHHLSVQTTRFTALVEERLLWKMLQFLSPSKIDTIVENVDESSYNSQRAVSAATSKQFKRYYFHTLKIVTGRVNLSMLTASNLETDLKAIKNHFRIPLVKFEDVKIELDPFVRLHPFETSAFLLDALKIHYTEELKSQAAKILGSVDFLGNPLGLVNDVAAGVSGLLMEGNVGGLITNLAHGVSNSTAKMTGSLSDGFGVATFDTKHQQKRQRIKEDVASGSDHIIAGFKGLGHGLMGGFTSLVSQTYRGARDEGFGGLITGIGRGVVGTVTKPVAGVLDLASGAANAVRDTSRGESRKPASKMRPPRCCSGPGGLLPLYSEQHARAQEELYVLNKNKYSELFIALEEIWSGQEYTLKALISTQQVFFLSFSQDWTETESSRIMLNVPFDELFSCCVVYQDMKYYLQLTLKSDSSQDTPHVTKRPLVRCDTDAVAHKVSVQINYAKNLFDEAKQTLPVDTNEQALYNA